jgi:hypothetical protein
MVGNRIPILKRFPNLQRFTQRCFQSDEPVVLSTTQLATNAHHTPRPRQAKKIVVISLFVQLRCVGLFWQFILSLFFTANTGSTKLSIVRALNDMCGYSIPATALIGLFVQL